jgi:hypothetical protein
MKCKGLLVAMTRTRTGLVSAMPCTGLVSVGRGERETHTHTESSHITKLTTREGVRVPQVKQFPKEDCH